MDTPVQANQKKKKTYIHQLCANTGYRQKDIKSNGLNDDDNDGDDLITHLRHIFSVPNCSEIMPPDLFNKVCKFLLVCF